MYEIKTKNFAQRPSVKKKERKRKCPPKREKLSMTSTFNPPLKSNGTSLMRIQCKHKLIFTQLLIHNQSFKVQVNFLAI